MAFLVHLPQLSALLTLLEMIALLHEFTIVGILLRKYEVRVPNCIGIFILYTVTAVLFVHVSYKTFIYCTMQKNLMHKVRVKTVKYHIEVSQLTLFFLAMIL